MYHKNSFKVNRYFFVVIAVLLLLTSCKVDFSPNAEWKEIPVVYCVLDQNDDTTYVRIQKCFLGLGDNHQYTQISDSTNYPEGALTVRMVERLAYADENNIMHPYGDANKVFDFEYKLLTDKPEGEFSAPGQPVYVCCTSGQLSSLRVYELYVIKNATGDTIAQASTSLVGGNLESLAAGNGTFQFSGTEGSKVCQLKWNALARARRYQPMVRFYYRDFIVSWNGVSYDTVTANHHIDIPGAPTKSSTSAQVETYNFPQSRFLNTIKDALAGDTLNKNVIDTVDVYLLACSEDLAAYMYSNEASNTINQNDFVYTNIKGGLGVFASRRTHLYKQFSTPGAANSQYKKALKELGVGF